MKILPVLDIKDGCVVRGVAGERDAYRPVKSRLADSADVLAIAVAYREHFSLRELYVADLDAILERRPNVDAYRELTAAGFTLWIDAGLRDVAGAKPLFDAGAKTVIAGLETSPGPDHIEQLIGEFGADRVVFSLDMQNGQPMADPNVWGTDDPHTLALRAIELGVGRMIVLDLAGVGVAAGVPTLELCRKLRAESPHLELITGGGVRNLADLRVLQKANINAALVASALHNGSMTPGDLAAFAEDVTERSNQ